jgi:hypothetical protein
MSSERQSKKHLFSTIVLSQRDSYLAAKKEPLKILPLPRISVRPLFAKAIAETCLLQVIVEFSRTNR